MSLVLPPHPAVSHCLQTTQQALGSLETQLAEQVEARALLEAQLVAAQEQVPHPVCLSPSRMV